MNKNKNDGFENEEEALDFLLEELSNRKQKEKWAKTLSEKPNERANVVTLRRRIFIFSALAASIALLFFIARGSYKQVPDYQRLSTNMIAQTAINYNQVTRGNAPIGINNDVANAIAQKDYLKAIQLYKKEGANLSMEHKYNYALLLAKYGEQADQLILNLTQEIINSGSEFTADALWLTAAIHLRLENPAKAESALKELKTYEYKTIEINKILDRLTIIK